MADGVLNESQSASRNVNWAEYKLTGVFSLINGR